MKFEIGRKISFKQQDYTDNFSETEMEFIKKDNKPVPVGISNIFEDS